LRRAFALYARMLIKVLAKNKMAETFDEKGNRIFEELNGIYRE